MEGTVGFTDKHCRIAVETDGGYSVCNLLVGNASPGDVLCGKLDQEGSTGRWFNLTSATRMVVYVESAHVSRDDACQLLSAA
ncbi:hypothetical protein ACLB1G_13830 [Oxalobacteraceae bacterium A2-2]